MSKKYLNGKITITSLATPTEEDIAVIRNLSDDDYLRFQEEIRQERQESPISDNSVDDVFQSALQKAKLIQKNQEYAL